VGLAQAAPEWRVRGRVLSPGPIPLLMGIVNVTPDSFSDGGRLADARSAVEHGLALVAEGADLLDVGGESTRPGAEPVSVEVELERVVPVVEGLAERTAVPLSVDTTKEPVARAALDAGASIVNDVSALRLDPGLAVVVAEAGAGLVLMHMQGTPRTMQLDPTYDDLLGEIAGSLAEAARRAQAAGVQAASIALDPGIGFGKTAAHNYTLLARLDRLTGLGHPVVVGHSRKSFLDPGGRRHAAERVPESIAAGLLAAERGAAVLRVHDVAAHARALAVYRRWLDAGKEAREGR